MKATRILTAFAFALALTAPHRFPSLPGSLIAANHTGR